MSKIAMKIFFAVVVLTSTLLRAQAPRTWVSGDGNDSNPCSQTSACRTLGNALTQTAPGGEIDVRGAGDFGPAIITGAITIDGKGPLASILAVNGNGIVVKAGPTDVVVLRNLSLNGLGTGTNGIRFLSGRILVIENCEIAGFANNGVDVALNSNASVYITNTTVKNIGQVGIRATTTSGIVATVIAGSKVMFSNIGLEAAERTRVTLDHSSIEYSAAVGVKADSASADAIVTVKDSDLCFNGSGVQAGPGAATIFVGSSRLAFNTTAFGLSGGLNFSFGNNEIHSNSSDGVFNVLSPTLR